MIHTVRMTFRTDEDKLQTLAVPRADSDVLDATVKTAMQNLIAASIVMTSNGNLQAIEKAELLTKDIYEFTY